MVMQATMLYREIERKILSLFTNGDRVSDTLISTDLSVLRDPCSTTRWDVFYITPAITTSNYHRDITRGSVQAEARWTEAWTAWVISGGIIAALAL